MSTIADDVGGDTMLVDAHVGLLNALNEQADEMIFIAKEDANDSSDARSDQTEPMID